MSTGEEPLLFPLASASTSASASRTAKKEKDSPPPASSSVSVQFYPSENQEENLKCVLIASLCKIPLVRGTKDVKFPRFPAIILPDQSFVFGASYVILKLACHCLTVSSSIYQLLEEIVFLEAAGMSNTSHLQSAQRIINSLSHDKSRTLASYLLHNSLTHHEWPETERMQFSSLFETIASQVDRSHLAVAASLCEELSVVGSSLDLNLPSDGVIVSLKKLFTAAIKNAFGSFNLSQSCLEAVIMRCSNPNFGDFQCNNSMKLVSELKAVKASGLSYEGSLVPKDIASLITSNLPSNKLVKETTVAPNGFINIRVDELLLTETIANIILKGAAPPTEKPLKVLVDFSSPNIAKEMHVGHLRSTIIGDALCRMLEFCGHDVMRINHVGDWGTQFGMLISYLQDEYPDIANNPPNISDLTLIYKAAKKKFDEDESFKTRSRNNVVALQSGDPECRKIWKLLCDISRKEFQIVYDALQVKLTEMGESFYNPYIAPTLQELEKTKVVKEDNGMLIINLPHFDIPLIVRKSDGGFGYDSTDVAAIKYRLQNFDRDWLVYITDAGQAGHFYKVFDAAKEAGWVNPKRHRLDFIGFGVVCGDDGKKFKTRSGDTVRLIDLLNAARDRMFESLLERASENKTNLKEDEMKEAAAIIGYGAVKYFDLRQNPSTNYIFSYDRMLDTKGDTAVYLLFAYARVASIVRKGKEERGFSPESASLNQLMSTIAITHPCERALAFELLQFGDSIRSAIHNLMPSKLCDFLKQLSVVFTEFVTNCHVLNSAECMSRLALCEATRRVMFKSFELLGIGALERI